MDTAAERQGNISKREWMRLAVCAVLLLLFYSPLARYPMPRADDIYNAVGAVALARGQGFADISRPESPLMTKYGPLSALTFVPFVPAVGENWRSFRWVGIVCLIAAMPLLYTLLRRRASPRCALTCLVLYLVNPLTIGNLSMMGNVGITMGLAAGLYLLAERFPFGQKAALALKRKPSVSTGQEPDSSPGRETDAVSPPVRSAPLWILAMTVIAALLFYAHKTGLVACAALASYLFCIKQRRATAALVLCGALLLCFPWLLRSRLATGNWISRDYEAEIAGLAGSEKSAPDFLAWPAHMAANLSEVPIEIGHALFPVLKTNTGVYRTRDEGTTIQFFGGSKLQSISTVLLWTLFSLTAWGWMLVWRETRGFVEWHLPWFLLTLLAFFVGVQYLVAFLPFFYLYLWRGIEQAVVQVSRRWSNPAPAQTTIVPVLRHLSVVGVWILLLALLTKDLVVFWGRQSDTGDRDPRWAWVAANVPETETVYWLGLTNYAYGPWRFYDSGRKAVGVTAQEVEHLPANARFVALPVEDTHEALLQKMGFKPVSEEPASVKPYVRPEVLTRLHPSQQAWYNSLPPPQRLWQR